MKEKEPTLYIREMIRRFRMPGQDYITERMFSPDKDCVWDSGVSISSKQHKGYTDIFHFWVRAFFCFCENFPEKLTDNLPSFKSVEMQVACRQIQPIEFQSSLLALVRSHIAKIQDYEDGFFPESFSSLQKRSFSNTFLVLNSSDIQSSVGESDGEFIAFFHLTKNCTLPK